MTWSPLLLIVLAITVILAVSKGGLDRVVNSIKTVSTSGLIDELVRWEGEHDFLYRDSRGYVTTGIGHLTKTADAAAAISWLDASGGRATDALVRADWQRVASAAYPRAARYYEPLTQIRLAPGYARSLAAQRLEVEFLPAIRKQFPGFDDYPESAKSAIVDIAWNVGIGGLAKFTKLTAAANAGDWQAAALASRVRTSREERNTWRADRLRESVA